MKFGMIRDLNNGPILVNFGLLFQEQKFLTGDISEFLSERNQILQH